SDTQDAPFLYTIATRLSGSLTRSIVSSISSLSSYWSIITDTFVAVCIIARSASSILNFSQQFNNNIVNTHKTTQSSNSIVTASLPTTLLQNISFPQLQICNQRPILSLLNLPHLLIHLLIFL